MKKGKEKKPITPVVSQGPACLLSTAENTPADWSRARQSAITGPRVPTNAALESPPYSTASQIPPFAPSRPSIHPVNPFHPLHPVPKLFTPN